MLPTVRSNTQSAGAIILRVTGCCCLVLFSDTWTQCWISWCKNQVLKVSMAIRSIFSLDQMSTRLGKVSCLQSSSLTPTTSRCCNFMLVRFMDAACKYSKKRGYDFWRAFTTGKSPSMGGIPHDTHGMTTLSVRSFVKGIMRRLNLREEDCTKFMTGGCVLLRVVLWVCCHIHTWPYSTPTTTLNRFDRPDGDLGSNEILQGNENLLGVVDGSGVLYDPNGINREAIMVRWKYLWTNTIFNRMLIFLWVTT